jgi:hypothetical protein
MEYILVGPHAGKTIVLSKVRFVRGVAEVHNPSEGLHNILTSYYSAWPRAQAKEKQAEYDAQQQTVVEPVAATAAVVEPVAATAAVVENKETSPLKSKR